MNPIHYAIHVESLDASDGGGFVATVPDLPGCLSDGDTPEEARRNAYGAIVSWIEAARELGREIPPPTRLRKSA